MERQRHLVNHVNKENATNLASADTLLYSKALMWEWGGATFDYHWFDKWLSMIIDYHHCCYYHKSCLTADMSTPL